MNRISWIFLWRVCNKLILLAALFAPWTRVYSDIRIPGGTIDVVNGWNEILFYLRVFVSFFDSYDLYTLESWWYFTQFLLMVIGGICLPGYIFLSFIWLFFQTKLNTRIWRTSLFATLCMSSLVFLRVNDYGFNMNISWGWDLITIGVISSLLLEYREFSVNGEIVKTN